MRRFDNTRKPPTVTMSDDSKWRRKRLGRIYDYNYKVSEGYYHPQTDYIEHRIGKRDNAPPDDTHLSYAERFSNRPWYGGTRGLPYDERKSELLQPLLKPSERPRGSSLLRDMQEDAKADVPLHIRATRRKKKMEEEEAELGIKPKERRNKDSSASMSSMNIREEMKRIDDELNKTLERNRRSASLTLDAGSSYVPRRVSRHDVSSYTNPSSGAKTKTESSQFSSSYSSTRPPIGHRSNAREESTSNYSSTVRKPRSRLSSFSSDTSTPIMSRAFVRQSSELSTDDDLPVYSNRAHKIREERRNRESENLSDNIHKMVEKMRVRDVDPSAAYSLNRSLRASSTGPSSRSSARRRTKASNFVYGVGKY